MPTLYMMYWILWGVSFASHPEYVEFDALDESFPVPVKGESCVILTSRILGEKKIIGLDIFQ